MPEPGERIGDWIVEGRLGSGGMGTVFRCHNALAERIRAAVKVMRSDDLADFRERFVREVEALEQLEHPAIVRVKGWGEDDGGALWLAMDLVEGEDLGARLRRGPLEVAEVERAFADLADGLAHAHARNVFHRDIKPANILLQSGAPAAKLVDFGIAVQGGRTRLSAAGLMPGTPAYLAPEVFGGSPHPQSLDVYALGQVLYEALTGTSAFPEPEGMTTTARIAHVAGSKLRMEALDPGPGFPKHLRALVRLATHPDPTQRLADMETFASAVRGEVLEAPPRAASTMQFDLDEVLEHPAAAEPAESVESELDGARDDGPASRAAPSIPTNPGPLESDRPEHPPEPRRTDRVEPPKPPRPPAFFGTRTYVPVLFFLPLLLGLLILGALLILANGPGGRAAPTRVVVTGVDASTPLSVRVDGHPVEDRSGTAFTAPDLAGPVTIEVVGGPHCDLDAWAGTCDLCCGCATVDAVAGDRVPVSLSLPSGQRTLRVGARNAGGPIAAWIDGAPVPVGADGLAERDVSPGTHTVTLERGTCPDDARNCGDACPEGCASLEQTVEVSCAAEPLELRLDLPDIAVPTGTPTGSPTAAGPPAKGWPSLQGRRIRLLHVTDELDAAEDAADALRAAGATVETKRMDYSPISDFGRVVWWDPTREQGARDIGEVLKRIGYAEFQPRTKRESSEGLDYAVWFKAP